MSLFEFLMVLVSIIIGLGIAEILKGIAQLFRHRDSISIFWVHIVLIIFVFTALLQQWWEIWGLHDVIDWTFAGLLLMLSGPIGLFLIAHLLFPQQLRNADFEDYYFGAMHPIWWLAILTVVLATLFRPIITGDELFVIDNMTSMFSFLGFAVLALTKNRLAHMILVPAFTGAIVWDILAMSFTIS